MSQVREGPVRRDMYIQDTVPLIYRRASDPCSLDGYRFWFGGHSRGDRVNEEGYDRVNCSLVVVSFSFGVYITSQFRFSVFWGEVLGAIFESQF